MIAEGHAVRKLEVALARRFGFAAAIATGSGCQALLLALRAVGVGAGARVVLPTYVCPELLGVVEVLGAEPRIADVDETYQLDSRDTEFATEVDAVVLPSLFGYRATWQQDCRLPIIHDWAQFVPSNGARHDVDIAILSLGATKMLAAGEGGAVLVKDPAMADRVRAEKTLQGRKYNAKLYPLSDLQAALALAQLDALDEMMDRRRQIADIFLAAVDGIAGVTANAPSPDDVPFRLPLRLRAGECVCGRDQAMEKFAACRISARKPVADLLHHVYDVPREFPVADRLYSETISLPLYPALTDAEVATISECLRKVLS